MTPAAAGWAGPSRDSGFADGDPDDLGMMDMLTADRRPWLPDMF